MPRTSTRQATINGLDKLMLSAVKNVVALQAMGLSTPQVDSLICELQGLRLRANRSRCLFGGGGSHRQRHQKFGLCLRTDHDSCMTDGEFRFHFGVTRDCFWQLVSVLKDHVAFERKSTDSRGRDPKPAEEQLLVLMKHCGCEGHSASGISLGAFFGVASGAVDDCKKVASEALLSLEDRTHHWPSPEERRTTGSRIKEQWLFPNCVGLIDGMLLPLSQRPLLHGENYLSRKKFCAVVMLVVRNVTARILCCHVGWPGSVHDNGVWRNSQLFEHFSRLPKSVFLVIQLSPLMTQWHRHSNAHPDKLQIATILHPMLSSPNRE